MMSDLLGQAKSAATSAFNTASTIATQAANTAATTAQQVANSDTAKNLTAQASQFATTVGSGAANLAGQAHAQAHAVAPSIVPPPSGGAGEVDTRGDLSPTNEMDKAKLDKLFASRASANELQDKGILKGAPGDALAGKRAELEKSMLEDKLDKDIATRPTADELVKKGILQPGEGPSS